MLLALEVKLDVADCVRVVDGEWESEVVAVDDWVDETLEVCVVAVAEAVVERDIVPVDVRELVADVVRDNVRVVDMVCEAVVLPVCVADVVALVVADLVTVVVGELESVDVALELPVVD